MDTMLRSAANGAGDRGEDAGGGRRAPLPPPGASRSRTGRTRAMQALGVVVVLVALLLVVGFLTGEQASEKFESVGAAISTADGDVATDASAAVSAGSSAGGSAGGGAESADAPLRDDAAAAGAGTGGEGPVAQGTVLDGGRDIIATAELTVETDDVATAVTSAVDAAAPTGAVVVGQDSTLGSAPRATITFGVAPESFTDLQDRLAGLGTLVAQRVTTDDVTEQVVDLEARIATSRASVERIRALIAEATNVMDIASLEGELLRRESDLESLEAQLRTLTERVDRSTVVLTLTEDAAAEVVPEPEDEQPAGFGDGLEAGWDAFVGGATALLVVAGALAPFVAVVLLGFAAWRLVRRLRHRIA